MTELEFLHLLLEEKDYNIKNRITEDSNQTNSIDISNIINRFVQSYNSSVSKKNRLSADSLYVSLKNSQILNRFSEYVTSSLVKEINKNKNIINYFVYGGNNNIVFDTYGYNNTRIRAQIQDVIIGLPVNASSLKSKVKFNLKVDSISPFNFYLLTRESISPSGLSYKGTFYTSNAAEQAGVLKEDAVSLEKDNTITLIDSFGRIRAFRVLTSIKLSVNGVSIPEDILSNIIYQMYRLPDCIPYAFIEIPNYKKNTDDKDNKNIKTSSMTTFSSDDIANIHNNLNKAINSLAGKGSSDPLGGGIVSARFQLIKGINESLIKKFKDYKLKEDSNSANSYKRKIDNYAFYKNLLKSDNSISNKDQTDSLEILVTLTMKDKEGYSGKTPEKEDKGVAPIKGDNDKNTPKEEETK